MGTRSRVIIEDTGWNEIVRDVKQLKNKAVNAGLFGQGNPDVNLAYRGAIQEYGVEINVTEKMRNYLKTIGLFLKAETTKITIPPRPFTRQAFDKNIQKMSNNIQRWFTLMIENKISSRKFLELIGVMNQGYIRQSIVQGKWKENHPITIQQKGSSRPLISSGEMMQGVTYKIEEGRGSDD